MKTPANLPPMTHAEVMRKLHEKVATYPNLYAAAKDLNVSRPMLQFVLKGTRNIGPGLLKALGLRRVTLIIHRYGPAEEPSVEMVAKVPVGQKQLGHYPMADRQEPE